MLAVSLMLPAPPAEQVDPGDAEQVQVAPRSVAGTASVTVAPVTSLGPALAAVIVYVSGWPGTAVVWPSVLVTDRSASGVSVSESVALLFPGVGSTVPAGAVTVAVLSSVPVAAGSIVAVSV
jgi:hypothetical protein